MQRVPRYRLNVYAEEPCLDPEGIERPNLELAIDAARRGARDVIAADIIAGKPVHRSHRIEVAGEDGSVLHVVEFGDAVQLVP